MAKLITKLLYHVKPPCPKCPYTLGKVQFVTSPCPSCKLNNYETYHALIEGRYKDGVVSNHRRE